MSNDRPSQAMSLSRRELLRACGALVTAAAQKRAGGVAPRPGQAR
jgi:hypothetical protein